MAKRALCLGLLACLGLVSFAPPARADMIGRWPWSKRTPRPPFYGGDIPDPPPAVQDTPPNPTPLTPAPAPEPPRRTGPFRSCGSGMGAGLAGIGIAWGLMWVGHRCAARVARTKEDRRG